MEWLGLEDAACGLRRSARACCSCCSAQPSAQPSAHEMLTLKAVCARCWPGGGRPRHLRRYFAVFLKLVGPNGTTPALCCAVWRLFLLCAQPHQAMSHATGNATSDLLDVDAGACEVAYLSNVTQGRCRSCFWGRPIEFPDSAGLRALDRSWSPHDGRKSLDCGCDREEVASFPYLSH